MNKCYYCEYTFGIAVTKRSAPITKTRDHIYPISRGGNNCAYNIIHSCDQCNSLKGNRMPLEFSEFLEGKITAKKLTKSSMCFSKVRLQIVLNNNNKLIVEIEPYKEKLLKGYNCPNTKKNKPTVKQRAKMLSIGYNFSEILRHNEEISKPLLKKLL